MRRQAAQLLSMALVLCGMVPAARGTDVDTIRHRWNDLLVQEPATLAPKRCRAAQDAMDALEAATRRGTPDVAMLGAAAESRLAALDAAIQKTRAAIPDVLQARDAARAAHAPETAARDWRTAENTLIAAAQKLEAGRTEAGVAQAQEARTLYDQARLGALQGDVLGEVHAGMHKLDAEKGREYVPRSYVRALDAVTQAETLLRTRGDADPDVRAAARHAGAETRRAQFLLERIRGACEEPDAARLEATILEWQDALGRTLHALGADASSEEWLGPGLAAAESAAVALRGHADFAHTDAQRGRSAAESLEVVVGALQDSIQRGVLQHADAARASAPYERFQRLQGLLDRSEGQVFLLDRDVVLRLPGLVFASGDTSLTDATRALLDKVSTALKDFPHPTVVVEGHTDAQANPETSLPLSRRRAEVVGAYLVDHVPLDAARVTALGVGATRPLVAEDSEPSRALNRRIEIIISTDE
jgi:outer membrane protein OmpA-like peptidoglycan-associated protein